MPYNFLIGNKSNYSEDPSKKKQTYQESMRTKLVMDPKAMFISSPPVSTADIKITRILLTITGITYSNKPFDGNTQGSWSNFPSLIGVLPEDIGLVNIVENPYPFQAGAQFVDIGPGNNIGCYVNDSFILEGPSADKYYFDPYAVTGYANIT